LAAVGGVAIFDAGEDDRDACGARGIGKLRGDRRSASTPA